MNILKKPFVILLLLIVYPCSASNMITSSSIKSDFDSIYLNDKENLWLYLNKLRKDVKSDPDNDNVYELLSLLGIGLNNAEFQQFIHESIENLILENPLLIDDSLIHLPQNKAEVFSQIINNPIYFRKEMLLQKIEEVCSEKTCKSIAKIIDNKL